MNINMTVSEKPEGIVAIGKFVKFMRKNRELTLSELATRAGVGMNTLCTLEQGGNVNSATLLKILAALDIELTVSGEAYTTTSRRKRR